MKRIKLPIRWHLILSFSAVLIITLVVSLLLNEGHYAQRDQLVFKQEVHSMARILGFNLRAALAFEAPGEAEEILKTLQSRESTMALYLLNAQGKLVAQYLQPNSDRAYPLKAFPKLSKIQGDHYFLRHPIILDGDILGELLMAEKLERLSLSSSESTHKALINFGLCMTLGLVVAYVLGYRISRPLTRLSQIAQSITDHQDYSIRSPSYDVPEVNELSQTFNKMLERIQISKTELNQHVNQLVAEKENLRLAQEREIQLEGQLSSAKRMESLGLLAGGVAHDLNNLLGPVLAYPDLILSQLAPEDPICEDLQEIKSAAQKSAAIIQDLLTLARRGAYQTEPLSLNAVTEAFIRSPAFQFRLDACPLIQLQLHFDPDLPNMIGSVPHLTQVVMNISLNALESMSHGGRLFIRTRRVEVTRPVLTMAGEVPPGRYATLQVEDSGEGIPRDQLGHIFEPFFTRKKLGHSGTGLGLSVVYGITQDLGGWVKVDSEPDCGTTFTLYFPATERALQVVPSEDMPEGRNERILIVDDVEAQRKLGMRLLDQLGYRVAQAESGEAALDYIQREHVDLVLLDMIMSPGWDGLETYRQLRQLRPNIRCIICSGFSDKHSINEVRALGLEDHMMKPYTVNKLAHMVREVLDRPDQTVEKSLT